MAKKKRSPILQRALNLSKISIFVAKMRKPISSNLMFLKRTRKFKKLKILKHYNHAFIQEYQFSPSNTPLFHHHGKSFKKKARRDIYSMLFLCRCSRNLSVEGGESEEKEEEDYELEAPPITDDAIVRELPELSDSGDEDDSVDRRAEMFIQRFYEEMRMQRQKSVMQYKEMLYRGCS